MRRLRPAVQRVATMLLGPAAHPPALARAPPPWPPAGSARRPRACPRGRSVHVATSGVGTAERPRVAVLYDEFGGEDAGDRACDEVALPPAAAASVEADDGASADAAAIADVLVVTTPEQAAAAAAVLVAHARRPGAPVYHAVDTEVDGIDLKNETPVGHGQLVSFSVYGGPDLDLGGGKTRLWVDVLCDDGCLNTAVLEPFRAYLEDDAVKKVWHNYAFDRHTFSNAGVTPRGFGGDTMHMARLLDSSRKPAAGKTYSLESLSSDDEVMFDAPVSDEGDPAADEKRAKVSMKTLFGKPNRRKDGTEGRLTTLPSIKSLQSDPETRPRWIAYSALDAEATWLLRASLEKKLRNERAVFCANLRDGAFRKCNTLFDFYATYWRPFGELLVTMEREGMLVDKAQLVEAEKAATRHQQAAEDTFRDWAAERCAGARLMNVGSGAQVRQLLFAGAPAKKPGALPLVPLERAFKMPSPEWAAWDAGGRQGKAPRKQATVLLHGIVHPGPLVAATHTASGLPSCSSLTLRALVGKPGLAAELLARWDDTAADQAVRDATEALAAKQCGGVYAAFGGGREGLRAAAAVDALCEASAVDTLLTNFILPLQGDNLRGEKDGRVHCSLNINTETGRLSARRPNLQNQPALEKDRYGIRKAFVAAEGNALVVADYGQLELRLLAHMANCGSMLEAFRLGGDFHSRTAKGMYAHVREAVERGLCCEDEGGPPGVPLLKDMFAVERRRAKVLNFSIAYGKTKHGLSRDWNVSLEEAERTVEAWYSDRPEVKAWQERQHALVQDQGWVCTLLGRQRKLPDARARGNGAAKAHALRAAINTPIQGGAADVAMLAMLQLQRNAPLAEAGWRLLMQVHDEVILEGPVESAPWALQQVKEAMSKPFDGENLLLCDLDVSAKTARSWYAAK